jgi:hypothetical protein
LEYRAKLLELYYAKGELFNLIQSFINSAKYDKSNAHPFANYCLIRNLSLLIFNKEFETDIKQWQSVPGKNIRKAAEKLYRDNTSALKKNIFLE